MWRRTYFSTDIVPACSYCRFGFSARDGERILCEKHGIVSSEYACRNFIYCPLKRKPHRAPKLPVYTKEDFQL